MIQAELRLRRLEPLTERVVETQPATSDKTSYLLYLDEYWRLYSQHITRKCDDARATLTGAVMTGAFGLLCETPSDMVRERHISATLWGLLEELLRQFLYMHMVK